MEQEDFFDRIMEAACEICRWPYETAVEEQLLEKCEHCPVQAVLNGQPPDSVILSIYDQEEVYQNCTVQVLKNSYTGDISIGFWPPNEGQI